MLLKSFPLAAVALAALLSSAVAVAQESPEPGEWDCFRQRYENGSRICYAQCPGRPLEWTVSDERWLCPIQELGIHPLDHYACNDLGDTVNPVICYPPGTDPRINPDPISVTITVPGEPVTVVAPSKPDDTHKGALLAFGGAFLAGMAIHALSPHLPEGVSLRPVVRGHFRDGLLMTTAELRGDWREWSFSAFSAHTGGEWTAPRAQVRWEWAF